MRTYLRLAVACATFLLLFGDVSAASQREPIQTRARDNFVTAMQEMEQVYAYVEAVDPSMACPVPSATFVSSWGAPRAGHTHKGVDMMADFGTQILAPESGLFEGDGESFYLYADSGTTYFGTHNGGDLVASGSRVTRGQPISTVSNTGNASGGSPHLHFEIHPGGGEPVDPYPATLAACTAPAPLPPSSMSVAAESSRTNLRNLGSAESLRFCRFVAGGAIDYRFVRCLHIAHGHTPGTPGHNILTFRREARQLRAFLTAIARPDCSGPGDCPALIRRAFDHMGIGWQGDAAVRVATCESGLNPSVTGGGGNNYAGLFQQSLTYWPGRAATYGMSGRSPYDPWANAVVSAGMVRDTGGWSHWACSP